MANPLSGNLGTQSTSPKQNFALNPQMQQLKGMMNMVKNSSNSNVMIQQLIQSNPQLAQVSQLIQGKNPETVFRDMCKQRGIDPDEFINMLR